MMRAATMLMLILSGCSMGTTIREADDAYKHGQYELATKLYHRSLDEYRTPTEMRHVAKRLAKSAKAASRERLDDLDARLNDLSPLEQLEALYAVWLTDRNTAYRSTAVGEEVSQQIDAIATTEWAKVDALADENRLSEAVALARQIARFGPPDTLIPLRYDELLKEATGLYSGLAETAREPAKSTFLLFSAAYGGTMSAAATEQIEAVRQVRIGYQSTGTAANQCASLPAGQDAAVELTVTLDVQSCSTTEKLDEFEEAYQWTTTETEMVSVQRCENVLVRTRSESVSRAGGCYYRSGSGPLRVRVCETITETREIPVYKEVCKTVQEPREVEVVHDGTRTVSRKVTTHAFAGEYAAVLPDGRQHRAPFSVSTHAEERAWTTEHGSQAFDGMSSTRARDAAREQLIAVVEGEFVPGFHSARAAVALQEGRNALAAGDNATADQHFATAALLGGAEDGWLAALGFTRANADAALSGQSFVLKSEQLAAAKIREVELIAGDASSLLGSDGRAARGFPLGNIMFGVVYRDVRSIPTQANRGSVTIELSQALAILSATQLHNGWGLALWDHAGWALDFGSRTSSPHVYPDFGGHGNVVEESGSAAGAGVYYELGGGFRLNHIGVFAGARAFAHTFMLGDLAAASTGLPLTAVVELRANERYPVRVQVLGFSPLGDKDVLGAQIDLPLGGIGLLSLKASRESPTINVGGRDDDDRVRVGRHEATIGSLILGGQF